MRYRNPWFLPFQRSKWPSETKKKGINWGNDCTTSQIGLRTAYAAYSVLLGCLYGLVQSFGQFFRWCRHNTKCVEKQTSRHSKRSKLWMQSGLATHWERIPSDRQNLDIQNHNILRIIFVFSMFLEKKEVPVSPLQTATQKLRFWLPRELDRRRTGLRSIFWCGSREAGKPGHLIFWKWQNYENNVEARY